ncbi:Ig-like domain-containing protein [Staphylococcus chromogenes]|nr:Ig-like domain-containing protein [Staphylococcus chromogenes]
MVKYAKTPKSFINVKDLGFALLETDEADGTVKYTNITQTRGLQEISVETGGEVVNAYADGGIIESGNTDGEGKISMTMHAFPQEIRQLIFNEVYNEHGVYAEKQGKQNNYVAVWFKRERKDGTFQRVGLTKVMFSDPQIEGKTSEEDWEFSSEESEGTAMHRIADGKRKILFDSAKEEADEKEFFKELFSNEEGLEAKDLEEDSEGDFSEAEDVTITIEPSSAEVKVDSTVQLRANVSPEDAIDSDDVTFESSNTEVATVDENTGLVTGVSEGEARIAVGSASRRKVYAQATVRVTSNEI